MCRSTQKEKLGALNVQINSEGEGVRVGIDLELGVSNHICLVSNLCLAIGVIFKNGTQVRTGQFP